MGDVIERDGLVQLSIGKGSCNPQYCAAFEASDALLSLSATVQAQVFVSRPLATCDRGGAADAPRPQMAQ
jgi:hypothetical protein